LRFWKDIYFEGEGIENSAYVWDQLYAIGYLPKARREVRGVKGSIPKAGKEDPEQPKPYRPIGLTSFILKVIEKLINLHIRTKQTPYEPTIALKAVCLPSRRLNCTHDRKHYKTL
jgi:hypothetical protein